MSQAASKKAASKKLTPEQRAAEKLKKAALQEQKRQASAAAAATPSVPLHRTKTRQVMGLMGTPLCISAFQTYLKEVELIYKGQPWKHPNAYQNPNLVVENLIDLMGRRGFKGLTMHGVIDLCLAMQNSELDRDTICKHITLFTQPKPNLTIENVECKFDAEYLRNASTPAGSPLGAITSASTIEYTPKVAHNIEREMLKIKESPETKKFLEHFQLKRLGGQKTEIEWNDVWETAKDPNNASITGITGAFVVQKQNTDDGYSEIISKTKTVSDMAKAIRSSYQYPVPRYLSYYKLSPEEIAFIKELNTMQKKPDNLDKGIKIVCGMCWLCGTPIHVFVVKDAASNEWYILNKCGEDEHTIVPGIGNLIGTLAYNAPITISNILAGNTVMQMGLQPSHAWCNKVKSDLGFLLPPCPPNSDDYVQGVNDTYRLAIHDNIKGIPRYIKDVKQALKTGTQQGNQRIDSYELQFKINGDEQLSNTFAEQVRRNITIYINALCMRLNATDALKPVPARWQQALLRTIFNACIYAYEIRLVSASAWKEASYGGYQTKYKQTGGENFLFNKFCVDTQFQLEELDLDDSRDLGGEPSLNDNIKYLKASITKPIVKEALNIDDSTCHPSGLAFILNEIEFKNVKPANTEYNANVELTNSNENNFNEESPTGLSSTGLFKGMKSKGTRGRTLRTGINSNEARRARVMLTRKQRAKKRRQQVQEYRRAKEEERSMGQGGGRTYKKRRILHKYHGKSHHRRKTRRM